MNKNNFITIGLIIIFITPLLLYSQKNKKTNYIVKGKYIQYSDLKINSNKVYLHNVDGKSNPKIDSSIISKEGEFKFSSPNIKFENFYFLSYKEKNNTLIYINPKKKIEVSIDPKKNYQLSEANNSDENLQIIISQTLEENFKRAIDSLEKLQKSNYENGIVVENFNSNFFLVDSIYKNSISNLILAKPTLLTNLAIIEKLDIEKNFEVYDKLNESLKERYKENVFVRELNLKVSATKTTKIGSEAPEISMNDTAGTLFKLSSMKGKWVLIDFWASWCRPCRLENPNMVRIYNKYKDKGFDILGVSLDRTANDWKMAIIKDGLVWNHVSDLKYWQSYAAMLYGVKSIPHTFLIDPLGKIAARNLKGEALEKFLEQNLKN